MIDLNMRQYRFLQIHKEKINMQVEELLEGGTVKPSQLPYNMPIWIVPKKEDTKGNGMMENGIRFPSLKKLSETHTRCLTLSTFWIN